MGVLRVRVDGVWKDVEIPGSAGAVVQKGPYAARPAPTPALAATHYWATDRRTDYVCDDQGWVIALEPSQLGFHPVVTAYWGTPTIGNVTFMYARSYGYVDWQAVIDMTAANDGDTNLHMTLPFPSWNGQHPIGTGRESNMFGYLLSVTASAGGDPNACQIQTYGNGWPGGDGAKIELAGRYRMANQYS